jgi:hypothetical protein
MQMSKSPIISGYVIEEKDVVNKLVKTRRLIQEQDIETIPRESNKIGKLFVSLGRTVSRDKKSNYVPV